MNKFACGFFGMLFFVSLAEMGASQVPNGPVLIYNGVVAAEGGPEAVAAVALALGRKTAFIGNLSELPAKLKTAACFVIGGTQNDLSPLLKAFSPTVRTALTEFIKAGGSYWGICGGAYLASTGWEEADKDVEALGLIPAASVAWIEEADPRIISIHWSGKKRSVYYQYGPAFLLAENAKVEILAKYDDGQTAALYASLGGGRVIVCGPHPEADRDWLDDDPIPLNSDSWSDGADIAQSMLRRLLEEGNP